MGNAFSNGIETLRRKFENISKAQLIIYLIMTAIVTWIGGSIHIAVGILAAIIMLSLGFITVIGVKTDELYDKKTGQTETTEDIFGDAQLLETRKKQCQREIEEMMECGDYQNLLANYLGADPQDRTKLYSLRRSPAQNGNSIYIGAPGAGKSAGIVIPTIIQIVRRGESAVVTDPKGELYAKTALFARKHGYTVKAINFNARTMIHSDSVNYMGVVGDNSLKAISFASTIIRNTSDGKLDFWDKQEQNLLTALILAICNSDEYEKSGKNLTSVYKKIAEEKAEEIAAAFEELTWDSPAKGPGATYGSSGDKVQGDTKGGLAVRLASLNDKILQRIASIEDIDFTLPAREKCIYYVISNDHDSSLNFYQTLFFKLLTQELADFADYETGNLRHALIRVTFIMDEFANLGMLPDVEKALATFRGRWLDFMLIIQNIGQLQAAYPDGIWESIIDCCSVMVCLRTNTLTTAKYFADRMGIKTIITKSKRYAFNEAKPVKIVLDYQANDAYNKRNAMNPDQVMRLKDDEQLVLISGHNGIILKKPYYFYHPMCKELIETNITKHVPKWVMDLFVSGDMDEIARVGIKPEEWKDIITYENDMVNKIQLCTEDDWKEEWNAEKQKKIDKIYYGTERENEEMKELEEWNATELALDIRYGKEDQEDWNYADIA